MADFSKKTPSDTILDYSLQRERIFEEKLNISIAGDWIKQYESLLSSWKGPRCYVINSEGEREELKIEEKGSKVTEIHDDPIRIEETLRRLSNFSNNEESLDPGIYEILEPGSVLLSWNKVEASFDCFEGPEIYRNGGGFVCIVQGLNSTTTLWLVGEHGAVSPSTLLEKTWIYRKGRTVLLAPDHFSALKMYKFETAKHAAQFEFDVLVAGDFGRYPILRLWGIVPVLQLKCKWSLMDAKNIKTQVRMLEMVVAEESDDPRFKISFDHIGYTDNIRRKIEDFLKYIQRILAPIMMWSSKFTPSEQTKSLIIDVRKYIHTVLVLLPFLNENFRKFKKSLEDLAKYVVSIDNTLICCQMMIACSEKYSDYFLRVERISRDARSLLDACISLEENKEQLDRSAEDDLHKAVVELKRMSLIAKDKETPVSTRAVVDCIDVVCSYLVNQRTSHGFPEIFDKLDYLLRVGNESVFDVLSRNFEKEMIQSLLPLNMVENVVTSSNEMLAERPVDPSTLNQTVFPKEIRLSELQDRRVIDNIHLSVLVETDEVIFCQKVTDSILLLNDILTFIAGSIGFKKELWMELQKIRTLVSDLPQAISFREEEKEENSLNSLNDVENVDKKDSNEDYSLCEDAYENIFSCPRSWDTYRKFVESEFTSIKTLGTGTYGEARLVEHYLLRHVVCKQFLNADDEKYITKEIDMLVKLQGNKNIVRLYGFYYSSKQYLDYLPMGIVMEYVELSLHGLIHGRNEISFTSNYSLKTALEYVQDMASAFSTMHALGFYHRDINPKNVLLTYDRQIRICDFGTCGIVNKTFKTGQLGTHQYKSPEMLNVQGEDIYNEKTDVYSLAVTIWELIHRRLPYTTFSKGKIRSYVYEGGRPEIRDAICPEGLKEIIQRGWAQKASDRPTMSEIQSSISSLLGSLPEEALEEKLTGPRRAIIPVDL